MEALTTRVETLEDEVERYLGAVTSVFSNGVPRTSSVVARAAGTSVADQLFTILTSREFCYLGRTKAAVYHDETVRELSERTDREAPAWFSYDIGPGYHASIRPGRTGLSYEVGLSSS